MVTGALLVVALGVASISSAAPIFNLCNYEEDYDIFSSIGSMLCDYFCSEDDSKEETTTTATTQVSSTSTTVATTPVDVAKVTTAVPATKPPAMEKGEETTLAKETILAEETTPAE